MSRPIIYLGPSLPLAEARAILEADYRPPVKRGDLSALHDAELVGIIDGVFLQNCSVGHREILALIQRGVRVVGGGSMGALRAAEMRQYGMKGVGRIFEMYASGRIEGDDEVALVFDPENMEPLSEPMVNLRFMLDRALELGEIDDIERGELIDRLRSTYYPRRNIPGFLSIADTVLGPKRGNEFRELFVVIYHDIKKEDAISVVNHIKNMI